MIITTALLVGGLVLAASALAHVTVSAPGATRGGSDQLITFRVPVEKDVATVGLTVQLPTDTPLASVLVEPKPGWTHREVTSTLAKPIKTDDGDITQAVTQVAWTADAGAGLKPGEFGTFTLLAGKLPDAPSITFPAVQTYADGSQVKWIEVAAPGSTAQPEHPAPVLTLPPATGSAVSGPASATTPSVTSSPARSSSSAGAVWLSIIALVVAAGAVGFTAVTRARRQPPGG